MKKIKSFKGRFQEVTVKFENKQDKKAISYKHFSVKDPGILIEEEIETKPERVDEREVKTQDQLTIEALNARIDQMEITNRNLQEQLLEAHAEANTTNNLSPNIGPRDCCNLF